jgi:predicted MPP superfamily phosphohydrolase
MALIYLFRMLVFLLVIVVLDVYAWQAIKVATRGASYGKYFYWGSSMLVYAAVFYAFLKMAGNSDSFYPGFWVFGFTLMVYVPKLILCGVLILEDVFRVFEYITLKFSAKGDDLSFFPSRRKFVSTVAVSLAAIPFVGIFYGMARGKYRFRVEHIPLEVENLPVNFHGFKVVQFSDFHAGSFTDMSEVQRALDMIMEQKPDVIVFTGDMVNNKAKEFEPYVEMMQQLEAPFGKYSVLGNHDYGDYVPWDSDRHKVENLDALKELERKAGFRLLLNEHEVWEIEGEQIAIVGVENYGKPPFPQKGDLALANEGLDENLPRLLLSHDPSHFDLEVKNSALPIFATLSGHTHGMQFGVEIPGWIQWSPVKWRYPKWAGLYTEGNKNLYVNRGIGYIGYPGRLGIWPEITVLELKAKF